MIASVRIAAASLLLALVAAPRAAAQSPQPSESGAIAGDSERVAEVARLVNQHRAQAGCPPLAWDGVAARAAQAHSDDMARRDYFDDVSPEGKRVGDRVRAAGAAWLAVAENIASGLSSASDVVKGWLDSAQHRGNIESCIYTRQGVGYRDGVWTHVFYLPR